MQAQDSTQQQKPQQKSQSLKQQQLLLDSISNHLTKKPQHQQPQSIYQQQTQQPEPQSQHQPQQYQPLEGYVISKTLGKGNFGKVKLAQHKLTQQLVAVKILQKDLIFENTDIVRITRELKIMKKLRHPFVVQLYQIIETPKQLYLIMEYAQGGDLFDKIVNEQKIKQKEAAIIFTQIALGMEYFHAKGVTHRDLKPENILLSKDGTIKIADFGLGNMFKPDEKLKTACGSPCYASPQMLNREAYDPKKIDIWSAGIILYALVCGYLPFEDKVTSKLYQKIKSTNVKLPSWISSPCRNLIRGLLTKDPKLRFDIESILTHQMIAPHVQDYRQLIKQRELTENKIEEICEMYEIEERQKLVSDLNKNRHNNLTTLYYLAVRRIERQEKEEEDEGEEEYLRSENLKVKGEGKGKEEGVENLTGIYYEEGEQVKMDSENKKGQNKGSDQKGISANNEEEQMDIEQEQKPIVQQFEQNPTKTPTKQQNENIIKENIIEENNELSSNQHQKELESGAKSMNTDKQLSQGELQIHRLHHDMIMEMEQTMLGQQQIEIEGIVEKKFAEKEVQQDEGDGGQEMGKQLSGQNDEQQGKGQEDSQMEIENNVSIGQRVSLNKQTECKIQQEQVLQQQQSHMNEPVINESNNQMDQISQQHENRQAGQAQTNEQEIIQHSYQLSMQIENTLAQLNQLTQEQPQPQQRQPHQHQQLQQQKPLVVQIESRPCQQDLSPRDQEHFKHHSDFYQGEISVQDSNCLEITTGQTVRVEQMHSLDEEMQSSNINFTNDQHEQITDQTYQLKLNEAQLLAQISQPTQVHAQHQQLSNETHVQSTYVMQDYQQSQQTPSEDNEDKQIQLQQSQKPDILLNEHQIKVEESVSLQSPLQQKNIQQQNQYTHLPLQNQQPLDVALELITEHPEQPKIQSQNQYNSVLFSQNSSHPTSIPFNDEADLQTQQEPHQSQLKQPQLSFSHVSEVQTPQIPPQPIILPQSPIKTTITKINNQVKFDKEQKGKQIKKEQNPKPIKNQSPAQKPSQPKQSLQSLQLQAPKQQKPSKLSRQPQNRQYLFSNEKTLSKPIQQKQHPQTQKQSQLVQQKETKIKPTMRPLNRDIKLNERSQSKDSPIAFKSNKNPNKLSQMIKNNNKQQKEQSQQQSPRPKQIKQKFYAANNQNNQKSNVNSIVERQKSQSRQKESQKIKNSHQKNTIPAKQKRPVVREKFQIAKKVQSKIYSKINPSNPTNSKNKSVEKKQKQQKSVNQFKQITELITQQPERSIQKGLQKSKSKISNPILNSGSSKKVQKNFSDRFRKNADQAKPQTTINNKQHQQVPISPVSGHYSKGFFSVGQIKEEQNYAINEQAQSQRVQRLTESQYSFREQYNSGRTQNINSSQTHQNSLTISYISKEKQGKFSKPMAQTRNYNPKTRTKITISQYSTMNLKPSTQAINSETPKSKQGTPKNNSSSFISTKFYQPKAKYSNIYQTKTSGNKNNQSPMNNTISYYNTTNNSKSYRNTQTEHSQADSPIKSQNQRMSATSNSRQFQRIEIDHMNLANVDESMLNINFVHEEPTLINHELVVFVSVGQLYQIVEGLGRSGGHSIRISGGLTVFEYPTKEYLYVMKSDLYGNSAGQLGQTQYGRNKHININKNTKITTFQFVQLINSIVLDAQQ